MFVHWNTTHKPATLLFSTYSTPVLIRHPNSHCCFLTGDWGDSRNLGCVWRYHRSQHGRLAPWPIPVCHLLLDLSGCKAACVTMGLHHWFTNILYPTTDTKLLPDISSHYSWSNRVWLWLNNGWKTETPLFCSLSLQYLFPQCHCQRCRSRIPQQVSGEFLKVMYSGQVSCSTITSLNDPPLPLRWICWLPSAVWPPPCSSQPQASSPAVCLISLTSSCMRCLQLRWAA